MALLFTSWWIELYFTVFLCLLIYYLYFKLFASKYWQKLSIFHVEPLFLLGNIWNASFTDNFAFLLSKMHIKHKEKKLVGFWNFRVPMLLVTDIEIIKRILASDFSSFRDRGFEFNFDHDPLAGNLFNIGGAKWRNLRVRLTPTFTSGKMKMMFPTLVQCGEVMQEVIKDLAGKEEGFEVKDILARYSTDVISSCAFGIETNSLKNPDSEFRKFGKKIFDPTFLALLRGLIFNFSPYLFSLLKFKFTPADVSEFFLNAVRETMEYREKHKVRRNDFMELLIQLKNKGKLEDVDGVLPSAPVGDAAAPPQNIKFTFNEAAAQAFVFFAAGFETSSTTLTFALYELSLNTQIQYKLQKEIDGVLEKNGGKMSYEGVMNSEYLDWVVQETLRKHPPVPTLFRQCNKDYKVPEMDVTIPNKTTVVISAFAIHRDPEYFPEPEKFDPERFSPEEKEKRDSFTFLPFGEGPRNCIGNRFGLMQTKVGLFTILSKFSVEPTKRTLIPLKYDKKSFVLASEGGVILRFVSRH